ncbi:MAG: hypothetical protein ACKOX6_18315 [Bdellovibrio sp.]
MEQVILKSGRRPGKNLEVIREELDSYSREELTELLMVLPGHDEKIHYGLALTQTGLLNGCPRCEILMRYKGPRK